GVEPPHRKMVPRRLEILADRQDVESDPRQVVHHAEQLVPRLTVTHLDPGFREKTLLPRLLEHHDRALIVGRAAYLALEPGDAFDVVAEHVGFRGPYRLERRPLPQEVGGEQLDARLRRNLANLPHGLREDFRSAVFE